MRRCAVLTAAVLAALTLAACQRVDGDAGRPPEPGDRAVARVDGRPIWTSDVRREAVAQGLIGQGDALEPSSALFSRVLDEVIDQKLLAREAERRNLDDDPATQRRLEATRERILADLLVEDVIDGAVTDEAIEALHREQLRQLQTSEELKVRLILTATQAEAEAVRGLVAAGAGFAAVAAERSIDPATRASGGDLGWTTLDVLPEPYAAALTTALAGTGPGAVTPPIETEDGWAVLTIEDRRAEAPPTLEQARPQIVRYLTYERVRQLLEQLRGRAEIEPLTGDAAPAAPAAKAPAAKDAA
ncbi:peptidyl-prolyl cis-trans isomerase [Brevundimonas sp.]|uniref:peptidylprolyl isomerase n=1 Tax=Brevundimonas sp. TaxID=1871086 RepID=UPI0035AED952